MRLMRTTATVSVLALAMLLVLGSTVRADNPPATKLAVVNIVSVFKGLDAKKAGDAEIDVLGKKLEDERRAKQDELESMKKEMEGYNHASDLFRDMQDKLFKKAMELEAFSHYIEQKLLMEQRVRTAAIYKSMNDAIEGYSKANGIALVLVVEDASMSDARTPQDLLSKITVRKVMYADSSLDITAALIEKMNSEGKRH